MQAVTYLGYALSLMCSLEGTENASTENASTCL